MNEDVPHVPLQASCDLGGFHGIDVYSIQKVSLPNEHLDLHLDWASGNAKRGPLLLFWSPGKIHPMPQPENPPQWWKMRLQLVLPPQGDWVLSQFPALLIHPGILCQSSNASYWNLIFCVIPFLSWLSQATFSLHLLLHLENQTFTCGLIIKTIFFGKSYYLGGFNPVEDHIFRRRSVLTFTFELLGSHGSIESWRFVIHAAGFNFYDKHLKSSSDYEQILAHFYPCFSSYESSTHKVVKEAGKHQCILKIVRSNVWSVSFTLKSLVSLAKSIQFQWPHWQKCRCGPSPVVKRRQDGQL